MKIINFAYATCPTDSEYQADFLLENKFAWLNTQFQRLDGKLWTYIYPNDTIALLDYMLINKKWINNALNCVAYSLLKEYLLITESFQQRYA